MPKHDPLPSGHPTPILTLCQRLVEDLRLELKERNIGYAKWGAEAGVNECTIIQLTTRNRLPSRIDQILVAGHQLLNEEVDYELTAPADRIYEESDAFYESVLGVVDLLLETTAADTADKMLADLHVHSEREHFQRKLMQRILRKNNDGA